MWYFTERELGGLILEELADESGFHNRITQLIEEPLAPSGGGESVASTDPEGNENKSRAAAEQYPSGQDKKTSVRETTSLSHVERAEAEICPTCNEYRAKEYAHWNRQTFWQRLSTIFTGLAFAAAAIYACYAHQQVAQAIAANGIAHQNAVEDLRAYVSVWWRPESQTRRDNSRSENAPYHYPCLFF